MNSSEPFLLRYSTMPVAEVVETGDPVDALGLPEALGPPDVLITDIDLRSELNGFEVASYAHHLLAESADYPDQRAFSRPYRAISRPT